jgi:hypothetical protein
LSSFFGRQSTNIMSAETRSDKDSNTAKEPSSAENSTARDPTLSEASNTAKEANSSALNRTANEPGTDTDRDNRDRIKKELEGPVKENYLLQSSGGYGNEEFDMTAVMFARNNPTLSDPATAEAESARKKKLASKKK